jgi:hypothetical protein
VKGLEGCRSPRRSRDHRCWRRVPLGTTSSSARPLPTGYWFACDRKRLRLDRSATPVVLQGRDEKREANPLL